MSSGLKIGRGIIGLIFLMVVGLLLQACGPSMQTYRRDISNYSSMALLKLKVPAGETKKAETSYAVAFVAPSYETAMQEVMKSQMEAMQAYKRALATAYGMQPQQYTFQAYRRMDAAKFDYFDQVKKYFQTDLEQILLAKNIRVLGIFKTHDEMTFDEKKRATYTFTPEISITVDTKFRSGSASPYVEDGSIIVNGVITLTLRESITGEKLWVKRIEAEPIQKPYRFVAKYKEPYRVEHTLGVMGVSLSSGASEEKDDTDQVLAAALSEFYGALGDKLWRHIDPEEWSKYLTQAEDVRRGKRY